jgi:hypothetical protein
VHPSALSGGGGAGSYNEPMGLFDTIYVSRDVVTSFDLRCSACGEQPPSEHQWSTKDLDACMVSYLLRHDEKETIRLYRLDPPSDRRFWRAWSEEDVAQSEADAEREGRVSLFVKRRGEGAYLPEAYLPENRRHRFMGELPHQWVGIYTDCRCGEWIERWIKFSDGVAIECRASPPARSGFDARSDLR